MNLAALLEGQTPAVREFLLAIGHPSLLCILGSRMFFNLKEAGKQGLNEGTSYRPRTVSNMEFEQGEGGEREYIALLNICCHQADLVYRDFGYCLKEVYLLTISEITQHNSLFSSFPSTISPSNPEIIQ